MGRHRTRKQEKVFQTQEIVDFNGGLRNWIHKKPKRAKRADDKVLIVLQSLKAVSQGNNPSFRSFILAI